MYTELFNPIYGTVDGLPVIVVGVLASSSAVSFVCVNGDGRITERSPRDFIADVRFGSGEWQDVSPGAMQAILESEPRGES